MNEFAIFVNQAAASLVFLKPYRRVGQFCLVIYNYYIASKYTVDTYIEIVYS